MSYPLFGPLHSCVVSSDCAADDHVRSDNPCAGEYWPSEESIKRISKQTPVLFLTGRQDELVPPSHMDVLMANCQSEAKVRMALEEGNHNNTCIQVRALSLELCASSN